MENGYRPHIIAEDYRMHIDLVHDTACPWCRIGKHNLRVALAAWQGEPVTIRYWPYMLNPDLPPEGADYRAHMQRKYGGRLSLQELFDRPTEIGASIGLTFNFDAIDVAPNTLLSHRVIALAPDEQREALVDAIYAAYFEDGKNISRLDVLLDAAGSAGLDRAALQSQIGRGAAEKETVEQVAQMYQSGVSGVPFFIFNGRWALSGAQPSEVFTELLTKLSQEAAV